MTQTIISQLLHHIWVIVAFLFVGRSVGHVLLLSFCGLQPHCSCPKTLLISNTAPAHPHATDARNSRTRQPQATAARDSRTRQPQATAARNSRTRQPHATVARDSRTRQPCFTSPVFLCSFLGAILQSIPSLSFF